MTVTADGMTPFTLPLVDGFTYDFTVTWGDGTSSVITAWDDADKTHSYDYSMDPRTVSIFGTCTSLKFFPDYSSSGNLVRTVESWGLVGLTSLYQGFRGCANLTSIPSDTKGGLSGLTGLGINQCFTDCTALTTIGSGAFDYCSEVTNFNVLFKGCTSLTDIPAGLFDGFTKATGAKWTFSGCTSLTAIPAGLFDNCTKATSFFECFMNCTSASLTAIPAGLFDNCTEVTTFEKCFYADTSLTAIPAGLFDNCTKVTSFVNCFYADASLTGAAPELWTRIPEPNGYMCFGLCTSLSNYASIPNYWGGP